MDVPSASSAGRRHGSNPCTVPRRRHGKSHSSSYKRCTESSIQARLVMDQISTERAEQYTDDLVQSVLQHQQQQQQHVRSVDNGAKSLWDNSISLSSKITFPSIGTKAATANYRRDKNTSQLRRSSTGPHDRHVGRSRPPNSLPSSSGSSSTNRKTVLIKPLGPDGVATKQRSKSVVTKGNPFATNSERDPKVHGRPHDEESSRIRRSYTAHLIQRPTLLSPKKITSSSDSNKHVIKSMANLANHDTEGANHHRGSPDEARRRICARSSSREDLERRKQQRPNLYDFNFSRERSFEITYPGYDTRFVDFGDTCSPRVDVSITEDVFQSKSQAKSIEKCRQWLNRWVL